MAQLLKMLCVALLLALGPAAVAQEAAEEPPAEEAAMPAPAGPDYSGDWLSWPTMTGDWGGLRTDLADKGITLDMGITQIMQGNMHGGANTNNGFRYSGSADVELTLDFTKMNLIPGGSLILHAEPKWGRGIGGKAGSLIPVNFDAVKSGDEECMMTLSEVIYQQVLFADGNGPPKLILIGGKLWGARAFDTNMFANDERTQFMNVALRNNILIPPFLPYTNLGIGAIVNPTPWLSIISAVADSDGRAKTTGFETTFHGDQNWTVIHEWAFTVEPFGLPGHQKIGFAWSSKDFPTVAPNEPFKSTGGLAVGMLGPALATKVVQSLATFDNGKDNVMIYYNFDQYLYQEEADPSQGIGMFGRFGWARQAVNPAAHFYSIGMGGKGIVPERDNDTFGLGYFFVDLSNDLPPQFHSEQGLECFYNIELTPWLHITPDLQVIINPGGTDFNDVSVLYGLRAQMTL